MSYRLAFNNTRRKQWICICKRKNDSADEKCAFCGEKKEESKSINKFNAKKQDYNGRRYDSQFEARYAGQLDFRKIAGELSEIKAQYKIPIKVNGAFICNYYCDFRTVRTKDGIVEYHEVKGLIMPLFALKWKLLNALKDQLLEPGAELIMIKT